MWSKIKYDPLNPELFQIRKMWTAIFESTQGLLHSSPLSGSATCGIVDNVMNSDIVFSYSVHTQIFTHEKKTWTCLSFSYK